MEQKVVESTAIQNTKEHSFKMIVLRTSPPPLGFFFDTLEMSCGLNLEPLISFK